ncbi:MAG TPA: hypothetical protein VLJ62_12330 [Burkholderiaceae bacterium]|nr:hypothetical protein [Burkholderiaceae bacterium]
MTQPDPGHGDLMNYLVRMVVPMRREFGRQLDVRHFLHDLEYAREVIRQALSSQDPRLLQYAKYVEDHHLGPRNASNAPAAQPAEQAAAPAAAMPHVPNEVAPSANPTAQEMRERVLRKYTRGLR